MNEKTRLLHVLKGEAVDRPPVICPGGMMNASVTELLQDVRANHNSDVDAMVEVAIKVHALTGFENLGVPFDMTVESEPLGACVDWGDKELEPRVTQYSEVSIEEIISVRHVEPFAEKRMATTLEAIGKLKNRDIPVIGNVTGHFSTATSVIDPLVIFKMLRNDPEKAAGFFKFINDYSIIYAREMVKAGADVIAVSDPTATGDILGTKYFEKFAAPYYKLFIENLHALNVPVIVHICGNANTIVESLNRIGADALSFDSIVNMRAARKLVQTALMGNVNTQLLHTGEMDKIRSITANCIDSGVDIVAPACGLSMATPVHNLKAMTDFVRKGSEN